MEKTVLRQIHDLHEMPMSQLRKRWEDLFGNDPRSLGRSYLIRRLSYRIQELAYGGLSHETQKKLKAIGKGKGYKPQSQRPKAQLATGTRMIREWRGDRYEVVVQTDGYLYNGKKYRSLSSVAHAITGAHWSGNRFFGLTRKGKKQGDE